ncbi:hypothetical protein RND81_03G164000 [Saponaria officinalis]|uniref:Rad21/Rec8-like protein N-terminal domain-containing protein n=1 Tax=Saponaria officinalis TaxID=3572 RepID=A0AAW1M4G8_SAPOF
MHAKKNRRKLDQIDIIRICEEILNPSVPMALRLSGILMGGVVIVYERKVRLLHDDVNRFLLEISSAWKVKPAVDPTVLPKGKNQAKRLQCQKIMVIVIMSGTLTSLLTAPANLQAVWVGFSKQLILQWFDIEGDEETTQFNIPSQEHTIPPPNVHSPPPAMEPQTDYNTKDFNAADDVQHPEKQVDEYSPQLKEDGQQQQLSEQKRNPARKRVRRQATFIMDTDQTMIPSNLYQSWLQHAADIRTRRPKVGEDLNSKPVIKVTKLVNLPPVAICCGLIGNNHEAHYPMSLLKLWLASIQPPHDFPSARTSSPRGPETSSSSPPSGKGYHDPPEIPMGQFDTTVATERLGSREKLRSNHPTGTEFPIPEFNEMFPAGVTTNLVASGHSSGTSVRSFASPVPGSDDLANTSDNNSGRLNKRRRSSRLTGNSLESLDEENQWVHEAAENNLDEIQNSQALTIWPNSRS